MQFHINRETCKKEIKNDYEILTEAVPPIFIKNVATNKSL